MIAQFRKNTYGMMIFLPTGIDLTGWTHIRLNIFKPGSTTPVVKSDDDTPDLSDKDAAGAAAPTQQKIRYVPDSTETIWDTVGIYKIVPQVEFTGKLLKGVPQYEIEILEDYDG